MFLTSTHTHWNSVKQQWSIRGSPSVMVFMMQTNKSHCMPCSWDTEHQPHHRQFQFQLTHHYYCLFFNGCTYTRVVIYGCCTKPFKDVHIIKQPRRLRSQTQAVGKSQAWEQGLVCFALAEAQQWGDPVRVWTFSVGTACAASQSACHAPADGACDITQLHQLWSYFCTEGRISLPDATPALLVLKHLESSGALKPFREGVTICSTTTTLFHSLHLRKSSGRQTAKWRHPAMHSRDPANLQVVGTGLCREAEENKVSVLQQALQTKVQNILAIPAAVGEWMWCQALRILVSSTNTQPNAVLLCIWHTVTLHSGSRRFSETVHWKSIPGLGF